MNCWCFHRDLKPSNILIDIINNDMKYYISDFSESKILEKDSMN